MNTQSILQVYDYAFEMVSKQEYYDNNVKSIESILRAQWYKFMHRDDFFREYVWVVFCSGFRVKVVSDHWPDIGRVFHAFNVDRVKEDSIEVLLSKTPIKNMMKVASIWKASSIITTDFVNELGSLTDVNSIYDLLQKLPFVGKITAWHLMRNIGVDCFKPDRHIVRLSELLGCSPDDIFRVIIDSGRTDLIGLADVILWYACATLGSADTLIQEVR